MTYQQIRTRLYEIKYMQEIGEIINPEEEKEMLRLEKEMLRGSGVQGNEPTY